MFFIESKECSRHKLTDCLFSSICHYSSIIKKIVYAIILSAFAYRFFVVILLYDEGVFKSSYDSIDLRRFEIAINANSSLGKDIQAIRHYPHLNQIEIVLKNDGSRRCENPVFRGRLSGQSLSIIDWKKSQNNSDIYLGNYSDLNMNSQLYFIEIIVLFCNEIHFLSDFKEECLENPNTHRITVDGAKINVLKYPYVKKNYTSSSIPKLGFWMGKRNESVPLYTRYQDPNCRLPAACDRLSKTEYIPFFCDKKCLETTDTSRFHPYHFVWNNESHSSLEIDFLERGDKKYRVCFLGASQSRVLTLHCNQLLSASNTSSINCIHIDIKYPKDINATSIKEHVLDEKCTHLIIGVGQWSAGWPENKPTLFPDYKHQMREALNTIQNLTQNTKIAIFLRSIHYSGINYAISACPPSDWRSIPVIDMYNEILKNIAQSTTGITYLDTNSIIGPLWDSAPDYFHFSNKVGMVEAIYLLREVIGMNRLG